MLITVSGIWPELKSVSPVIRYGSVLVPAAMLPAVPLGAVADPTVKLVPPWRMVIRPALLLLGALPPVSVAMAERLQGVGEQIGAFVFGIVPVARKLPPAVMSILPPFLPSALIWVTWMSLPALRVTVPPSRSVDVASMDPVLMLLEGPAVIVTFPALPCLSLDPALILPVSTFPVTLVTVMLPPEVVLELESRSRVLMSPLACRAIAPPWVVRFVLTARLLAA